MTVCLPEKLVLSPASSARLGAHLAPLSGWRWGCNLPTNNRTCWWLAQPATSHAAARFKECSFHVASACCGDNWPRRAPASWSVNLAGFGGINPVVTWMHPYVPCFHGQKKSCISSSCSQLSSCVVSVLCPMFCADQVTGFAAAVVHRVFAHQYRHRGG